MSFRKMSASRWMAIGLFVFILALELSAGIYFSYVLGYMHTDALSRVANAFYVLYSRDPHLGAIGFIWNPLPSLLEMVILLLYPIFPALASYGLAAVILSATFSALTAMLLYRAGVRTGLSSRMSLLLALLYALNPFILLFGANGLSDSLYIYFIMMTVIEFALWLKDRMTASLIVSGLALAMAFWTRYEAVPLGVAMAVGVVLAILFLHRNLGRRELALREKLHKVEATWLLLLLPVVFSGLLWIFFNYLIMGNAFYFLNSEYSNTAQSAELLNDDKFVEIFSNPLVALKFIASKTIWYSVPLFAILFIRLLSGRLFRWGTLIILLLFLSVPGLQFLLMMRQSSYGWFRYFMYVFPITVAWLPYELSQLQGRWRRAAFGLVSVSLLLTAGLLSYALTRPDIAPDENSFLTRTGNVNYVRQESDRKIAVWLDEHLPKSTIMTDSASAYTMIVYSQYSKRFLITSDYAFNKALSYPQENHVDYILVPKIMSGMPLSKINIVYPNLYEHGAPWVQLEREFNGEWRLYKVLPKSLTKESPSTETKTNP
ncbi:glycosyltransferase family 39 protein [Paenibacillus sp. EKM202P]|uniref:glycosyltransferase family 39 protein n=1 Tax=unclassified Paenibacillus TaxID=185978 RepID=UPI0013EAD1DF|nr:MULTISPECIES: glycosyltransferase family 39 protein [unclassified Paenibacillus]KAF6567446.1 glycosyltransferase family 39 protein [Paenibacillus sp. EKM202P]KAF6573440.1 glycosyltransferase family 39 protein [Paenibacillus sp. EKM207P]